MDLREFVSETLTEILAGVRDAQEKLSESEGRCGVVNPTWNDQKGLADHVQSVKFDVAVTVSDQTAKDGKAGIKVFSVELGRQRKEQTQSETVSRILFSVPILPSTTIVQGVEKPTRQRRGKE